jgi:cytidylate kinase
LTALVQGLAEAGDVVIVGRGSQAILGNRHDAVHVQVVCDLSERVRRIAERDGIEPAAANARIQESDRERNLWYRKYFAVDFESPHLYDVILNTARLGEAEVTHQVISLVHARVTA